MKLTPECFAALTGRKGFRHMSSGSSSERLCLSYLPQTGREDSASLWIWRRCESGSDAKFLCIE